MTNTTIHSTNQQYTNAIGTFEAQKKFISTKENIKRLRQLSNSPANNDKHRTAQALLAFLSLASVANSTMAMTPARNKDSNRNNDACIGIIPPAHGPIIEERAISPSFNINNDFKNLCLASNSSIHGNFRHSCKPKKIENIISSSLNGISYKESYAGNNILRFSSSPLTNGKKVLQTKQVSYIYGDKRLKSNTLSKYSMTLSFNKYREDRNTDITFFKMAEKKKYTPEEEFLSISRNSNGIFSVSVKHNDHGVLKKTIYPINELKNFPHIDKATIQVNVVWDKEDPSLNIKFLHENEEYHNLCIQKPFGKPDSHSYRGYFGLLEHTGTRATINIENYTENHQKLI